MPSLSASSIAASTIFSTLISRLGPRCGVAATPHARAIPLGSCSIGSSVFISPSYIVYVIYCVLLSYTVCDIHRCLQRETPREGTQPWPIATSPEQHRAEPTAPRPHDTHAHRLRTKPSMPQTPSPAGTRPTAPRPSSTDSISRSTGARCSLCSEPTEPGRRPASTSSPPCSAPTPEPSGSWMSMCTPTPPRRSDSSPSPANQPPSTPTSRQRRT